MNAGVPRHHEIQISALLSIIEALLLRGETCPVTGLPARATSAPSSLFQSFGKTNTAGEGYCCGLWPGSESLQSLAHSSHAFAYLHHSMVRECMCLRVRWG